DRERLHVLNDGIGAWKAEGNAGIFGDADAVAAHIAREEGIDALEEVRRADRQRIDGTRANLEIELGNETLHPVERDVAVGTAEGPEEIDLECHGWPILTTNKVSRSRRRNSAMSAPRMGTDA